MITIGLIEDDKNLRDLIKYFINTTPGFNLLFSVGSISKWINCYTPKIEPQMILLDLNLPGISGIQSLEIIKTNYTNTKIIIISGETSEESIWQAFKNGADGYLLKPFTMKHLKEQINHITAGGSPISPFIAKKLLNKIKNENTDLNIASLTKKEEEVVSLILKGLSYKEIAIMLRIATSTVNDHIKKIYFKQKVNSKAELISKLLSN